MQYDRDASGTLNPLPAPCIDTGMGLERITSVVQGKLNNYDTDLFQPHHPGHRGAARGLTYGTDADKDVSLRVVADHLRATTFLIGDGVMPGNEGRGYVLRKIMRRAMRHGRKLGLEGAFLARADRASSWSAWRAPTRSCAARRRPSRASCARRRSASAPRSSRRWSSSSKVVGEAGQARAGRGSSPARTRSASTTPTACPSTSSRSSPRTRRCRWTARASSASSKASATARGRRARWARSPAIRCTWACWRRARRSSSDTRTSSSRRRRVLAVLREGQLADAPRRGPGGPHRPRPDALLRRVRRTGRRPRRHRRRGLGGGGRGLRPARPRPLRAPREGDHRRLRARDEGARSGRPEPARGRDAQPHRHPPAPRRAARDARHPRQAGGQPGGAGPPALRLQPLRGPRAARPHPHPEPRERADPPQRGRADEGHGPRGGAGLRRARLFRRQVRRAGAGGRGARGSPGSSAAAPTSGRPGTSGCSS